MNYETALHRVKKGDIMQREVWQKKGMFIFLVPGSIFKVSRPPLLGIFSIGTEITYRPHIDFKGSDGTIVPWVCTQTDQLAYDWQPVYEVK